MGRVAGLCCGFQKHNRFSSLAGRPARRVLRMSQSLKRSPPWGSPPVTRWKQLLGAYLVQRFAAGRRAFHRAQHVFTFTAAATVSTTVSATFGVTALSLAGLAPWPWDPAIWLNWWIGDTVGAPVFAPLLILILGTLDTGWRAGLAKRSHRWTASSDAGDHSE